MLSLNIGTLALVIPISEWAPLWPTIILCVCPIALFLLGQSIDEEVTSTRWKNIAQSIQQSSAIVLLALLGITFAQLFVTKSFITIYGFLGGLISLPMAWSILSEEIDEPNAFESGTAVQTQSTFKDTINVIGLDTIGFGIIGLLFVLACLFIINKQPKSLQAYWILSFFAGCTFMSIHTGLEHWVNFVPGRHQHLTIWLHITMSLGLTGMGLGLLGFLIQNRHSFQGQVIAVIVILCIFILGILALKRWLSNDGLLQAVPLKEGITIYNNKYPLLWAWEDISEISLTSISNQPFVMISFYPDTSPYAQGAHQEDIDEALEKHAKTISNNKLFFDAEYTFSKHQLSIPPAQWFKIGSEFLTSPEKRLILPSYLEPGAVDIAKNLLLEKLDNET